MKVDDLKVSVAPDVLHFYSWSEGGAMKVKAVSGWWEPGPDGITWKVTPDEPSMKRQDMNFATDHRGRGMNDFYVRVVPHQNDARHRLGVVLLRLAGRVLGDPFISYGSRAVLRDPVATPLPSADLVFAKKRLQKKAHR